VGSFFFTMNVTDGTQTATSTFNLVVESSSLCGAEVFQQSGLPTIPLPDATAGFGYGAQLFVGGGTPPYTWSLATGALPPGQVLDSTLGLIRGTPLASAAGQTFSFTVKVTDQAGETATCPNADVCPVYQVAVH
jgi:hypothetical protein